MQMNDVNRHRPPAWHLLAGKQLPFSHEYHEKPRTEIMPLLPDSATCILDVGCGTGVAARMLGERYRGARLYGVEIQPEAAAIARERLAKVSAMTCSQVPSRTPSCLTVRSIWC